MSNRRLLPHNLDCEASVLGGVILRNEVLRDLTELERDDFYDHRHKAVFEAMRNLEAAGAPIDVVTLEAELQKAGKLDAVGGVAFFGELALKVPTADNVLAYAAIVREHATSRQAILEVDARRDRGLQWAERELDSDWVSETIGALQRIDERRKPASNGFRSAAVRVLGERAQRQQLSARQMRYGVPYLDDVFRAILPVDTILLGAETGLGKTELALNVATANVRAGNRVGYFALEAEENELEMREKHRWLSRQIYLRRIAGSRDLPFVDWYLGKCDDLVSPELDAEADAWIAEHLAGLMTYYRGRIFGAKELTSAIEASHRDLDMIVVDHLHYVDARDDQDENRALTETLTRIRELTLEVKKPMLVVAHMRKKDERLKQIVPTLGDFHGTSNLTKIATHVITIARAEIESPKWYLAPTYMVGLKDRRAGAMPLVALSMYDKRTRVYEDTYTLGRLTKGRTAWEQLKPVDAPSWARGYRQLELDV